MIALPEPILRQQCIEPDTDVIPMTPTQRQAMRAETNARFVLVVDRIFDRLSLITVAACFVAASLPLVARLWL